MKEGKAAAPHIFHYLHVWLWKRKDSGWIVWSGRFIKLLFITKTRQIRDVFSVELKRVIVLRGTCWSWAVSEQYHTESGNRTVTHPSRRLFLWCRGWPCSWSCLLWQGWRARCGSGGSASRARRPGRSAQRWASPHRSSTAGWRCLEGGTCWRGRSARCPSRTLRAFGCTPALWLDLKTERRLLFSLFCVRSLSCR